MERKKNMLKWDINISSVAVGFLLALCLFLALGADGGNNNRGRYECCAAGTYELAVFVIDTQTGQTWRLGRNSSYDCGTAILAVFHGLHRKASLREKPMLRVSCLW